MAHGVPAHAGFATGTGFNTAGTALALHVNLDVWNSLPAVDKAALEAATLQEFHASCAEARAHDAIAKKTIASRYGVAFTSFPPDIAEAVKRVADTTVAHVAGRDAKSKRIDASYMAFRTAIADTQAPLA
jgi:TRAP-type mannitol/chloroaromatic compound transport system substrate-binding protein